MGLLNFLSFIFDVLKSDGSADSASARETVGDFEKKHNLPHGTFRNKNGRDTRSDKLMDNVMKNK